MEYFQSADERLSIMKGIGVDLHVVSITPALYRHDAAVEDSLPMVREVNDELSQWQADFPDNYRGLATLPLQDVRSSVNELETHNG